MVEIDVEGLPYYATPRLSNELRQDVNSLVANANSVIKSVIEEFPYPKINNRFAQYVDPNPNFDGHRYCEDSHASDKLLHAWDIWLWNGIDSDLDHSLDATTSGNSYLTLNKTDVKDWASWYGDLSSSSGGGSSDPNCNLSNGRRCRTLHPKVGGDKLPDLP